MNPKPFSSLNHLTVPRISVPSLLVAEATNVLQSGPDKAEPLAPGSSGETDATTGTTVTDSPARPPEAPAGAGSSPGAPELVQQQGQGHERDADRLVAKAEGQYQRLAVDEGAAGVDHVGNVALSLVGGGDEE